MLCRSLCLVRKDKEVSRDQAFRKADRDSAGREGKQERRALGTIDKRWAISGDGRSF